MSPEYTSLSVSGGIAVELISSLTGEGSITADEEVLEYVSIVEERGKVKISYEPFISVQSDIKTVVSLPLSPVLTRMDVSSAARVTSEHRVLCSSIEIDCSSAGAVELDLDAQKLVLDLTSAASFAGNVVVQTLEADLDSAAKCDIEGSAGYCSAESSSAANFQGVGLLCRRAEVDASSGGGIEISIVDELDAEASSGGSVRYKGSPAIVRRSISSGGSIRPID